MTSEQMQIGSRESILVPVAAVSRERRVWHTRIHVCEKDLARLTQAIESSKVVVPIRVVRRPDGAYEYVSGLLRLIAVERLGQRLIPAFVESGTDEEFLLRTALIEQEVRFPLKTLERGWALLRLQELRRELGRSHLQTEIAQELGIDEGDVSTALAAARTIPQERAEEMAQKFGITLGDIAKLPRDPLRRITRTCDQEERQQLLDTACSALSTGANATQAVRGAHEKLEKQNLSAGRGEPTGAVRQLARGIRRRLAEALRWIMIFIRRLR